MASRKTPASNNHLQEAMALLIRNQAAFVEQIARNDQGRLALQRTGDERQLRIEEWRRKTEEWMRKSDQRFAVLRQSYMSYQRILWQTILDQLPRIEKEIGSKSP